MSCKYDKAAEDYLRADGTTCRHDDYGDPTRHCTARRTCAQHIGEDELTCARCVGRTRADLRQILSLAPLMLPVALGAGVDSEAANLAGPAADVEAWTWRKVAARQGRAWHVSLIEDDDERHPYSVLTRWEFMLREDYRQPRDDETSTASAGAYLDRTLHRVAQDDGQDFPLLARELRKVRNHLESVLRDSRTPERGAPCPDCTGEDTGVGPRLVREYGHWCTDPECTRQFHYGAVVDRETGDLVPDTTGDVWRCPRNHEHEWTHEDYARWIEDRREYVKRSRSVGVTA